MLIFAARCYASRHAVFVCPSVTFVNYVKRNKHIFIFLSPGSQTILVFQLWQYVDVNHPPSLTGASNAGGVGRNRDSEPISGSIACCERSVRQVQYTLSCELMTLVAGRLSGVVCWWRKTTTKCMTRSLNFTPKTTEQHLGLIVRSCTSEAWVTVIKDCARGITLLKLTTDEHKNIARPLQQQSYLPYQLYTVSQKNCGPELWR